VPGKFADVLRAVAERFEDQSRFKLAPEARKGKRKHSDPDAYHTVQVAVQVAVGWNRSRTVAEWKAARSEGRVRSRTVAEGKADRAG
jgi:hypothetical protein